MGVFDVFRQNGSPFESSAIHSGVFNPLHETTAAVVYHQQTVPKPWVVLLAEYLIGFGTCLWAVIESHKEAKDQEKGKEPEPSGRIMSMLKFSAAAYTLYRAVASTYKAFLIKENDITPTEDIAALALIVGPIQMLMCQGLPGVFTNARKRTAMLMITATIVWIAFQIPLYWAAVRVARGSPQYYGKWRLIDGNCPVVVQNCNKVAPLEFDGCGSAEELSLHPKNINTVNTANKIRVMQLVLAIFMFINMPFLPGVLGHGIQAIKGVLRGEKYEPLTASTLVEAFAEGVDDPAKIWTNNMSLLTAQRGRKSRFWAWGQLYGITSLAAVTLSLQIWQMTSPKPVYVVDGQGPLRLANATGPTDSWSDCFILRAPADTYGFMDTWIEQTDLVQKIALL